MILRTVLVAVVLLILLGVNGYLLYKERIAPSQAEARHLTVREDPLLDLTYSQGSRVDNLRAFGMDENMVARAQDRLRDLDDRHAEKLALLLENAPEPTEVADAICGQTNQVRPRYGALRILVKNERGQRDAFRVSRVTSIGIEEWSKVSPISEIYGHTELAEERKPDATMMAIAAILLEREEDLLNNYAPWGRGFANTWSWARVKKAYPGIEDRVLDYFALMHLTVEVAHSEGGICGQ